MVREQVWEETWQSLLPLYQRVAERAQKVHPKVTWAFFHFIELNETYAFWSYASASGPDWPSWESYDDGFVLRADCLRTNQDDAEGTLQAFALRDQFPDDELVGPWCVIPLAPDKEELAQQRIGQWLKEMAQWLEESMDQLLEILGR